VIETSSTELSYKDPEDENANNNTESQNSGIFPPHLSSDCPRASSERSSLTGHVVSFVNKQFNAFASIEDLFDILDHDVLDLSQILLRIC